MKNKLIAGDSWGIGVYSTVDGVYGPTGQGIDSILTKLGHNTTNISKGGGANWLMVDRMMGNWNNTSRCLFGVDSTEYKTIDWSTIDHIVFLQTDIFRERHYYGKQYPTDTDFKWKVLEQAFVDSLLDYSSLQHIIDDYFNKLYQQLNSIALQHNKQILMIGGWSQLHPSINQYSNLIPVVNSSTKLLIPELIEDVYLSDPEWYGQLANEPKFMQKFGTEFKLMTISANNKLDLIYNNWKEVHTDLAGYQTIVDKLLPYFG